MNPKLKSFLLWLFAFLFTAAIAIYQRMTGPTYPVSGKVHLAGQTIKFSLIRTYDGQDDAPVYIKKIADTSIHGEFSFRRFKSYDSWTSIPMQRQHDTLVGRLPHQPPAGKMMYQVMLVKDSEKQFLTNDPVVLRYKGYVPLSILIPHIIIIFLAMLFSTRTGLEVIFRGNYTFAYAWVTLITLFLGGLILGPIVQKYSFGVYWSGWPFGHDLTDNKSLVAFIFWVVALIVLNRNRANRLWPILASVILLIVFLIPHSMLGSEIDYTKNPGTEMIKK